MGETTPGDAEAASGDPSSGRQGTVERRQMTVLFCDLVDSTGIADQLDPEQTREILLKYQDVAATAIKRYGGHVAHYMGDGLLVYFGYPRAYEDAARRALLAALDIASAVSGLSPEIQARFNQRLDVRIGVHTGEVVIGEMGAGDWTTPAGIVGSTPNIAARLQALANANDIVTSESTRDLASGFFEFEDTGAHQLRGIARPVRVYRVLAKTAAQTRNEARPALSPMAGRQEERSLLDELWTSVSRGATVPPVLLLGEGGMGKSRLVQFIRARCESSGAVCVEARCSPYYTDTPFYAITQLVERECGIQPLDDGSTRFSKLQQRFDIANAPTEALPAIAMLMGIPLQGDYEAPQLSPEAFRALAINTLLALFDELLTRVPVLLVMEDLHWADDSTLALLDALVKTGPRARLLAIFVERPARRNPWHEDSVRTLMLGPLPASDCAEMVAHLARHQTFPPDTLRQIVDRSNGVPLFLEELVRAHSDRPLTAINAPVPTTLRDLLTERLEQPGVDKELAQIAATIGVDAPLRLLEAVVEAAPETARSRIGRLTAAGILMRDPDAPEETYTFRHALVRDAAYLSQLLAQRRTVHARVGAVLEKQSTGSVRPEILGLHFMAAEQWDKAGLFYGQAGNLARASGAEAEAIRHFTEALNASQRTSASGERDNAELHLRLSRAASYTSTIGYAAPAAGDDLQVCLRLCKKIGPSAMLLAALSSIWSYHMNSGDLIKAAEVLNELVETARNPEFGTLMGEVQVCTGVSEFFQGHFGRSIETLDTGTKAYQNLLSSGARGFWPLPNDPFACALAIGAAAAWIHGHHDLAQKWIADAYEAAELLQFPTGPFTMGFVAAYASYVHDVAGDYESARVHGDRGVSVSRQYGIGFWEISCRMRSIKARALMGTREEAAAAAPEYAALVGLWRQSGAEGFMTNYLTSLAEIYRRAGQLERALDCLEDALKTSERGEGFHVAEILRFRGEIRFEMNPKAIDDATADLLRAVEVAREQQAHSYQVRAATSLRRILPIALDGASQQDILRVAVEAFPKKTKWLELDTAQRLLDS